MRKSASVVVSICLFISGAQAPINAVDKQVNIQVTGWRASQTTLNAIQLSNLKNKLAFAKDFEGGSATCIAYFMAGNSKSRLTAGTRAKTACTVISQTTNFSTNVSLKQSRRANDLAIVEIQVFPGERAPVADLGIAQLVDAAQCRISSSGSEWNTVGFPIESRFAGQSTIYPAPLKGTVRALAVPVDFPSSVGMTPPRDFINPIVRKTNAFFQEMSYGAVDMQFTVHPKYVRMPKTAESYGIGRWNTGDYGAYYRDGLDAAARSVDLSGYDIVYIIASPQTPRQAITPGPAFLLPEQTFGGIAKRGAATGNPGSAEEGFRWMAHETGHLFGWADLYDVTGKDDPKGNRHARFGWWDIMSMNWEQFALDINAWARFQVGWLKDDDMYCLASPALTTEVRVAMSPLSSRSGRRFLAVRTGAQKVLVVEKRTVTDYSPMLGQKSTGLLVYEVDGAKSAAMAPMTIIRKDGMSVDQPLSDAALGANEYLSYGGLRITHMVSSNDKSVLSIRPE